MKVLAHLFLDFRQRNGPAFLFAYGNPSREKWVDGAICGNVVRVHVRGRVLPADPRLLTEQQQVEVWSDSQQKWEAGKVIKIGESRGKGKGPGRREGENTRKGKGKH